MSKPGLAARLRAAFLGDLEEQLASLNVALLSLEHDATNPEPLKAVFRVMHTLKGAAHATDQPLVQRACHHLEALLVEAREGRTVLGTYQFKLLFAAADALSDTAAQLAAGNDLSEDSAIGRLVLRLEGREEPAEETSAPPVAEPVAIPPQAPAHAPEGVVQPAGAAPAPAAAPAEGAVRVAADKLDNLLSEVGRLLATRARIGEHASTASSIQDAVHDAHATIRRLLARHGARLPADVGDAIREVELGLREASVQAGSVATNALGDVRELAEVGDALADSVRRVRMLPFSSACEPLPRLVRDVGSETGKPARLVVSGGDVEADRPVLDALKDSLLHLARNAIDHGIEPSAERAALGKAAVATVTVKAALHGERLTVTVSDDGAGLDVGAIRAKLHQQGREVPEDDADVVRALFESGFSTRSVTTTISGRGVGLDAVEAAMLRVRGSVSVSWVRGQGTTFTLECPLTLAAIRAVLVRSSGQSLALPTSNVEQLVRIKASDVRRAEGRDVILTGSVPIPLVSLATVLGPPFTAAPHADIFPALIVSAGERRVALVVDAVETEQELIIRPIPRGQSSMPHVSGGALLGTGQLVIVLNPVSLVHSALGSRLSSGVTAGARKQLRVIVVDDSMTTRALEQGVLEAAGYQVTTAVDGLDAWRQIQEFGADLVVSDIEMPNMDGLSLCRTIRASAQFANLPVVLVTSLDSPEDRARGMSAGADAYVGKASAGQAGLLNTVRELLA
ncbi:MAG: response regulator [Gemmatimonadota bacterium]